MPRRANYALCQIQQHLGPTADSLDVPWAEFTGDATDPVAFEVPTANPTEAYVQMQLYDADEFGHEILVNDQPLSGFDVAPGTGWQLWMDTIGEDYLGDGENTIRFRRDTTTEDAFVVGTATVHWKEPVA